MRVRDRSGVGRGCRFGGIWPCLAVFLTLAFTLAAPSGAQAQTDKPHSLAVNLVFPDEGIGDGEQLCVALFAGANPDLNRPPLLSRCLDPGGAAVTFDGLRSGPYSVLLPGPGSELAEPRYQGQLVATTIPEDDRLAAFGIDVNVGLSEAYAGTTGRVRVSVFGCPAGTDSGGDKDGWAAACRALAGGVALTLSGTGSIHDAAFRAVTGVSGDESGRVEFTNLPPGAYELGSELPENVAESPALFVESSIDGSLGSLDPNDTLALRPTETVAVDVYLVLEPDAAFDPVGVSEPMITGGVDPNSDLGVIVLD